MRNLERNQLLQRLLTLTIYLLLGSFTSVVSGINQNYTYLYYENGYPKDTNSAATADPDLIIQTGHYSLKLECDTMNLTGYDALTGSDYLSALTEDVTTFSPATLILKAYVGSKKYVCNYADVRESDNSMNVRLIQSGQYVQRFDHLGLVFTASDGSQLSAKGALEITAWPDHVTFQLDLSGATEVTRTTIYLISPDNVGHLKDNSGSVALLSLSPHTDSTYTSPSVSSVISNATRDSNGDALTTVYDSYEAGYKITVPSTIVNYNTVTNKDRVDEFTMTITNPTSSAMDVPLIFEQPDVRAVTGTMMMLVDPIDKSPLGIPVQVSKNWHGTAGLLHEGFWLRGYSMLPLAAGESQTITLRVVFGFWGEGELASATHSQLSLVGWNGGEHTNWKWDESALGSWGESLTYDPVNNASGSFMADIRPTFTYGYTSGTAYAWTENAGGGDFMVYYDANGTYRFNKKVKTCYRWAGPNLTEVIYSGVTDDDKIRYTHTVRGSGTFDYHRKYHKFKYEFLDAVNPSRFLFYQMASDNSSSGGPFFDYYYRGTQAGLTSSYTADKGGDVYKGSAIAFSDSWLSIDDVTTKNSDTSSSHRGMMPLYTTLNGSNFSTYMHPYGVEFGSTGKMIFDMSASSVSRTYSLGDVIEGEVLFMMPPKTSSNYWGEDSEFSSRLSNFTQPWNAVYDEFRYNRDMSVTMHAGTMVQNYPLEIDAANQNILADFTINSGGIGHVPVVLNDVPENMSLYVQRNVSGTWVDYEIDLEGNNDYYQGYYNASGSMDYTFSFKRPSTDLTQSWRIRIVGTPDAVRYEAEDFDAQSGIVDEGDNIGSVNHNDYVEYNNLSLNAGSYKILIGYSAKQNASIASIETTSGTVLGTVDLASTGSWTSWSRASGYFTTDTNITDLVIRFQHPSGNTSAFLCNIDWFEIAETNPIVILRKRNALGYSLGRYETNTTTDQITNGEDITLRTYDADDEDLLFEEIDRGNGAYSYQLLNTHYSLDGGNGGGLDQDVYLWSTNASNQNQQWIKVDKGNGFYQLQKANSTGYSIDGGSTNANGANVELWRSTSGSQNLHWEIEYK